MPPRRVAQETKLSNSHNRDGLLPLRGITGRAPVARLGVLAILAVALAGCQSIQRTLTDPLIHKSGTERTRVTADTLGRKDSQRRIAEAEHPTILATYGG